MKERIDICVSEEMLARNQANIDRIDRTYRFEQTDRVPVVVDAQLWFLLAARGGSFSAMCQSARDHMQAHILNKKWRIENIRDDRPVEMETLLIESDFGALRGIEFPLEILWNGDEPAKAKHLLQAPEDIDHLLVPDPDSGLNKKRIQWYLEMQELADDFDVRLNGEPLNLQIELTHPGGPFPSAFALCGTNVFLWMKTDPDRFQRLMEITTQSHLNVIEYFASITGREPDHSVWLGADTAEMVRPKDFQKYIAPYYMKIWEKHARPRTYHMCGKIDHILEILADDMEIDILDGFGFPTDRHRLAETFAGRVVMRGGPHPLLIHEGPKEAIMGECIEYIRTAGSQGGFILSEGFGLMAGTPLVNIEAMVEASQRASGC